MLSHYEVCVDISGCGQTVMWLFSLHIYRWSLEIHRLCKGTSNSQANWLVNSFCDAFWLAWSVKYDSTNLPPIVPQVSMAMPHSGWRSQVEEFLLCPLWPAETGQSISLWGLSTVLQKWAYPAILSFTLPWLYHDSAILVLHYAIYCYNLLHVCGSAMALPLFGYTIYSSIRRQNLPSLVPRPLLSSGRRGLGTRLKLPSYNLQLILSWELVRLGKTSDATCILLVSSYS